ncbi:MAG: Flp family type IVb pilin [Bacillota bacterium]|nr:Flp family type IVb pilin [Bacillota bacterium]
MRGILDLAVRYWRREDGQTMVEYEILMLLIAVACIALLVIVGQYVSDTFFGIGSQVP